MLISGEIPTSWRPARRPRRVSWMSSSRSTSMNGANRGPRKKRNSRGWRTNRPRGRKSGKQWPWYYHRYLWMWSFDLFDTQALLQCILNAISSFLETFNKNLKYCFYNGLFELQSIDVYIFCIVLNDDYAIKIKDTLIVRTLWWTGFLFPCLHSQCGD